MPSKGHSTILDLDNEIKLSSKKGYYKENPKKIKKLKESIERWEYKNSRINNERKKLKKEQISRGTTKNRIQQIDKILKGIEPINVTYSKQIQSKYKLKPKDSIYLTPLPISPMKNELNMISGKDFYFVIDKGIGNKTKVKHSKLVKEVKRGKSPSKEILKSTIREIKKNVKNLEKFLKSNSKKLSKKQLKRKKNQLNGLNKLLLLNEANLNAYETGDFDFEDFETDYDESMYPIIINIIGNNIRINA